MIHEKRPLDRTQVRQLNLLLLVQDLNATDPKLQEDSGTVISHKILRYCLKLSFHIENSKRKKRRKGDKQKDRVKVRVGECYSLANLKYVFKRLYYNVLL